MDAFDEGVIDFLFYMMEALVWRPDYLPLPGIGLPQINFDGPRLLGHAYLFEIDNYLNKETNGDFVRWMDDIDFGVQTIEHGKKILHDLDEILLTRGIRLNMGKTKILSRNEARDYFLPDENRYLTVLQKRIKRYIDSEQDITDEIKKLKKRFRKFLKRPEVGRWEKVYARYFTLGSLVKDKFLELFVPEILENRPVLRKNIFKYYTKLGPSPKRLKHLINFYKSNHSKDDTSVFHIAKVFTDWNISPKSSYREKIVELANCTGSLSEINFIASLWMLAKYGSVGNLFLLISQNAKIWKYSNFISRQVASVVPRLRENKTELQQILTIFRETGQVDAFRIVVNFQEMRKNRPISFADRQYYMHGSGKIEVYPLPKFLIVYNLLTSPNLDDIRRELRDSLIKRIPDSLYKQMLKNIRV